MTLLFSIGRAARYLGVSPTSLRRWDRAGKLIAIRTPGNQRRYPKSQLDAFLGICDEDYETKPPHASTGIPYLYARVSSARQETDGNLDRQAERLVEAVHTKFGRKTPFHLIREYASGLNPLRSGLRRLIHAVQRGKVSTAEVDPKLCLGCSISIGGTPRIFQRNGLIRGGERLSGLVYGNRPFDNRGGSVFFGGYRDGATVYLYGGYPRAWAIAHLL